MPMYPYYGDNDPRLWLKIAQNFYEYAVAQGITGLNPPSSNDNQTNLEAKVAYYTAALV